jgi:hypothetical protein
VKTLSMITIQFSLLQSRSASADQMLPHHVERNSGGVIKKDLRLAVQVLEADMSRPRQKEVGCSAVLSK